LPEHAACKKPAHAAATRWCIVNILAKWHNYVIYTPECEVAMLLQPIVPTLADASSTDISDAEAGALARTTVNLFNAWKLTDAQACTLLGGLSARTWARWKEGSPGRIDRDLRMRMAHLMGIHKGVRYLFKDVARGYEWIKAPNAAFAGKSALDIMLQGELSDLAVMREWLDAERSAW
jgi:uncharacterized protein (DUF2384 family)